MEAAAIVRKPNVKKEEVEQIRQLSAEGHTDQELADTFATHPKVIEQIRTGTFKRGCNPGPRGPQKRTVPAAALKEVMENIYNAKTREIEQAQQEIEAAKRRLDVLASDIEYIAAKNYLHALAIQAARA